MSDSIFTPGAQVVTARGQGVVVDVRAAPSGVFLFGVASPGGEVTYFTGEALRLAAD